MASKRQKTDEPFTGAYEVLFESYVYDINYPEPVLGGGYYSVLGPPPSHQLIRSLAIVTWHPQDVSRVAYFTEHFDKDESERCPVCDGRTYIEHRELSGGVVEYQETKCRCDLYERFDSGNNFREMIGYGIITGFGMVLDGYYQLMRQRLTAEARKLLNDWDAVEFHRRWRTEEGGVADSTTKLVFADWCDEHGFSATAAELRRWHKRNTKYLG